MNCRRVHDADYLSPAKAEFGPRTSSPGDVRGLFYLGQRGCHIFGTTFGYIISSFGIVRGIRCLFNSNQKEREMTTSYTASNSLPMAGLPTASGIIQKFVAAGSNAADATYAPDGLAAKPIFGLGGQALQGGEIIAGGTVTLESYIGPLLNGGAVCWVLLECDGGAQQVAPATKSQHAMQLGQATGRLLRTTTFTSSGTWTAGAGTTAVEVEVVGGGGGAGGTQATSSTEYASSSGGGGGGYARKFIANATSPQTITVGAGGVSDVAGGGSNGGTSSFGSLVSATGGVGGQLGQASVSTKVSYGGNGGIGSGGDINVPGNAAQFAFQYINEGLPVVVASLGGSSIYGTASTVVGGTPTASRGYGAGGSGASSVNSESPKAGAYGTAGVVIVREYS